MEVNNYYYYFKEALSSKDCEDIISHGLSTIIKNKRKGISTTALTHGNSQKKDDDSKKSISEKTNEEIKNIQDYYIRDSEVAWLQDKWIYDILQPLIREANDKAGWHYDLETAEQIQFTVYKPGGLYGWHSDGQQDIANAYRRYFEGISIEKKINGELPPKFVKQNHLIGQVRKISMTCNLSLPNEYTGGNLKFDFGPHHVGERYHEVEEIRPQGSVVVFPSWLPHCVTPIETGVRYSLVLWSLGRPLK